MIDDVDQYYCIAKKDSLTDAKHFLQVCDKFGLSYQETKLDLVDDDKISLCFRVEESLIDPQILKKICLKKLEKSGVNLLLNTKATKESLENYDKVVICAYANTNELIADYPESQNDYQFELCEKIVVELPDSFKNKSAVVLDGPFMCVDPYGSSGKFLLGNVVHAIHSTNVGKMPVISEQYKKLLNNGVIKNPPITKFDEFIAAGKYFFPEMEKARHVGSMFTFRTVLPYKDKTDERPTLVRQVSDKIFTIYSGKIISCVTAARQIQKLIG